MHIVDSKNINLLDTEKLNIFTPHHEHFFAMAQKDKIDFIYNTSALEGNLMTYPEVETLLDGVTVGGHKLSDEQQILNQNRSVNLLFKMIKNNDFFLDKKFLLKLHSKVAFEEALSLGKFRKSGVNIGGTSYKPPNAKELDSVFKKGLDEIKKVKHPIVMAITYFLFGAKCQFFYEGNKRTSRLMMNGILLKNGYPMLNIKVKDKLEFNKKMIAFYDGEDINAVIMYLVEYYLQSNKNICLD